MYIGTNDCTPEIDASEIVMDVQWCFQWVFRFFPTSFHLSVVCSKGMSLSQWMFTGVVQRIVSGIFQWMFMFVSSGV